MSLNFFWGIHGWHDVSVTCCQHEFVSNGCFKLNHLLVHVSIHNNNWSKCLLKLKSPIWKIWCQCDALYQKFANCPIICIYFTMKSNLLKRGLKQRFLLLTESMAGCAESVSTNLCPGLQFVRRHATLENYPFVIFPISRILLGWITLDFTDIHVKFCTPSIRKPRAAELGFKSANFTVNFKLYIFQIQTKTADKWKICRT